MPRYCFHFASKDDSVPDRKGVELPDLAAAHAHAVKLIQQTIGYVVAGSGWEGWKVDVSDASGGKPLTVLFPSVLPDPSAAQYLDPPMLEFPRTRSVVRRISSAPKPA